MESKNKEHYIKTHSKSQGLGFLLTLLFGPLGLLYSSTIAAIIFIVIAITTIATIIIPIAVWVFSIISSIFLVHEHNRKTRAYADLIAI